MSTAQNKNLLLQYNKEVIEKGDMKFFQQIATVDFINHSAPEGMSNGIDGVIYFFANVIHTALTDITVNVLDMVAEENKVATRKEINGIHTGSLLGIPPTGKKITITVIDIFTVLNGKLKEHWGENNFAFVIQSLQ